jgi:hypothetical protein
VTLLEVFDGRLLALLFGPVDKRRSRELAALAGRYPARFVCVLDGEGQESALPAAVDRERRLAAQAGAAQGDCALLRPDLHLAGTLPQPAVADIERALRRVLALEAR